MNESEVHAMKKLLHFTNILCCTLLLCLCISPQAVKASKKPLFSEPAVKETALRSTTVRSGSGITQNEYTITFNANYGVLREDSRMTTVNQRLTRLPAATRDGYTFKGWYTWTTGGTQITTNTTFYENTEVYAQWDTPNTNFSDILFSNITDTTASFIAIIPNCYVKTWGISLGTSNAYMPDTRTINTYGYTSTLATNITGLTPNTTYFYKVFYIADTIRLESGIGTFTTGKASEYTISFFAAGGTVNGQTSMSTLNQKLPVLPTASRESYRFDGWYTGLFDGTPVTTDTAFTSSCTVYAHWTYSENNQNTGSSNSGNNNASNGNTNTGAPDNNGSGNSNSGSSQPGTSTGTSSGNQEEEPVSVKKVKLKSVQNTGKGKVKVKWKWSSYADGYQIAYSQSKSFPSDKTNRKLAGVFTESKTVSGLKKGKTYYIRVRAYQKSNGKKFYGSWSNVKKIKTKK